MRTILFFLIGMMLGSLGGTIASIIDIEIMKRKQRKELNEIWEEIKSKDLH